MSDDFHQPLGFGQIEFMDKCLRTESWNPCYSGTAPRLSGAMP